MNIQLPLAQRLVVQAHNLGLKLSVEHKAASRRRDLLTRQYRLERVKYDNSRRIRRRERRVDQIISEVTT